MKLKSLLVSACLLAVTVGPCFALWSFGPISKERANELGIEIRTKVNGPTDFSLELDIKTEGELKDFNRLGRVELQVGDGKAPLVSATLKENQYQSKPGHLVFSLAVDRDHLELITLRVWVSQGLGGVIHELHVRDFLPADLPKSGPAERRTTAALPATNTVPLTPSINPAPPASEKGLLNK